MFYRRVLAACMCGLLTLGVLQASALAAGVQSAQSMNRIVAVVNSDIITEQQLDHSMGIVVRNMQQAKGPVPDKAKLRAQVLQQLIDRRMQLQIAKRLAIKVTEAQLDQVIVSIGRHNHLSPVAFKKKLAAQGIKYSSFRQQLREQLMITQVQKQAVGHDITITDKQVQAFKKQHGLIAKQQYRVTDYYQAQTAHQTLQQSMAKAIQFEKLLRSKGKVTVPKGWEAQDLGWRTWAQMPDVFVSAMKSLKTTGQITAVVHAANGNHILKLQGIKKTPASISDDKVKELLYQQKAGQAVEKWLNHLKKTAYIKINKV